MWVKETQISKDIKEYVNMTRWICKKVPSWKIIIPTRDQFWKEKFRAIQMEEAWTTDLVADLNWKCVWIEVKKDEKEYKKWLWIEKRYNETWIIAKSNSRERSQIMEKRKILRRGWNHILTYSLQDFIIKVNNLW